MKYEADEAEKQLVNEVLSMTISQSDPAEDDFSIIQQEIVIVKSCKHPNIVAYYGSYIR